MKNLSLLIALLSLPAVAQTRLISHKSHSGSLATFNTALENSLFDIAASNFGDPGSQMRLVVDTVILLPDNRAVVIASEKDVWVTYPKSSIALKPGRDTVYNAMLSNRHNKDSLVSVFHREGSHNPVLINYDNEKPLEAKKFENKKNSIPAAAAGNDNFPDKPMLIFVLALLSVVLGFVFFALHKIKSVRLTA